MQAIKTIVAATDYSAAAHRAVRRAALIARQQGAELHLLHVTTPMALYPGLALDPPDADDNPPASDQYAALARVLNEHYGIQVRQALRFGRAHSQIADYAVAVHAGLVVIGARGEGSVLNLLLGSTASRLLRVRLGPVLIVRGEPAEQYSRVLGAVDLLSHSSAVAAWAAKMAGHGQTQLVHVLEQRSGQEGGDEATIQRRREEMHAFAVNAMAALIAGLPAGDTSRRIETGYPPTRVLECAGDWRADMIVVGRQGAIGLEEFLLGSVCKDVVQAADRDVLVVGED